ncbi:MAG: tRNA 4-thiouridine(8) synthase ThiI, partial [Clostridia bacterium]|nr:tRNA 4-thiouridine(8) synthase ThiI [Clostridia bacterium]
MKEIILCKYGEIVLKGANKKYFEDMLCREMKKRAKAYGSFDIYRAQSTIYIEPLDDSADFDGMFEAAQKVFGIVTLQRAAVCEKNMDAIAETVRSYLPDFLSKA